MKPSLLVLTALAVPAIALVTRRSAASSACQALAGSASSGAAVYYPLNLLQYQDGIEHWMSSSTQQATCVFEPASQSDVALALQAIAAGQVPFAVKGGGHASNPGFSSTTGLQITMSKFSQVTLSADKSTVEIGMGLTWDQVYSVLDGSGVNIVGGRVPGVGVAGFTLGGGGYSWKTNRYGLSIDSVQLFNLVLPNGTITTATATTNPDLFFALKGGYNNYGIVTSMVMKTISQSSSVYGGSRIYGPGQLPNLMSAIAKFSANKTSDPRAQVLPTLNSLAGIPGMILILLFDGPKAELPPGTFDDFNGLIAVSDSVKEQTFASFVSSTPAELEAGFRGVFHSVMLLEFTPSILAQVMNQTLYYSAQAVLQSDFLVSYDIEPFLPSLYDNSQGGAWPHSSAAPYLPLNIYFSWTLPTSDAFWIKAAKDTAALIKAQAVAEGQDVANANLYPNYAVADTPLEVMYGANLPRLQEIKAGIDPSRIMDLAGGFKI